MYYVDFYYFDQTKIITDVETELSRLKLEFHIRNRSKSSTSDDLYRHYQDFIPLSLGDVHKWLFPLVMLFLNILLVHLQKLVLSQRYKLSRFGELNTAERQHCRKAATTWCWNFERKYDNWSAYTIGEETMYWCTRFLSIFLSSFFSSQIQPPLPRHLPFYRSIFLILRVWIHGRIDDCLLWTRGGSKAINEIR